MPNRFPNLVNTPPGGWRYLVPDTEKLIGPFSGWGQLHDMLAGHYRAAGYEMPADIFDKVQAYICEQSPEHCGVASPEAKEENRIVKAFKQGKHTFHLAIRCLSTLVSHRAGSGEKPPLELQEKRAAVCVACPKNTEVEGCSMCNFKQLKRLVEKLVGAKKTTLDAQLKFCEVCHCANSAKIATKHEAIWTHLPQSQREALPSLCWLNTEHEEKEKTFEST